MLNYSQFCNVDELFGSRIFYVEIFWKVNILQYVLTSNALRSLRLYNIILKIHLSKFSISFVFTRSSRFFKKVLLLCCFLHLMFWKLPVRWCIITICFHLSRLTIIWNQWIHWRNNFVLLSVCKILNLS